MSRDQEMPSDGVIDHYLGDEGCKYFAWQGEDGIRQALYNKHLWQPYITQHDDILDFGCGGGFLLNVLEGKRKAGVEVNPRAMAQVRALGIEVYGAMETVRHLRPSHQ